ncbi:MAG TPA: hypothetical protein VFR94_08445 [Nitrososphaeraceae archaeon]|nr:hypothetical protein [Nitrososphaeraceae archaeon]
MAYIEEIRKIRVALNELYHKIERMEGERLIASSIHLKEEEVYDIFRNIFHNEEDALAATIQLFRGDPIPWDQAYD